MIHKSVDGVVLAAGASRRAGSDKLRWNIAGKPLLERTCDMLLTACRRVIVVTGPTETELPGGLVHNPNVVICRNPEPELGMFSSVQAGVSKVRSNRFLIQPADIPFVSPRTVQALLAVDGIVVSPQMGGRSGHPILLDACLIPGIGQEDTGSSLRQFLAGYERVQVAVDDTGILFDIDRPEDLVLGLEQFGNRFDRVNA